MSDKGGKGYSQSALKSPGGKGDSSAKGKRVQFENGEHHTPMSNGTAYTANGKGGKGGKSANGAKKSTEKTPAERLEQEIPDNSICLMDCEAAEILLNIQDQMVLLSQDPDIKLPVSFDLALAYAKRGGDFGKPETIKKIFEPLKKHGVSDWEICLIVNTGPETVDEAFALVPSLKVKSSNIVKETLRIELNELANLKEALANLKSST